MAPAPQWLKDIQASSIREESYAEATDRLGDFDSARRCVVDECGVETPPDPNLHLFDEE